MARSSEADRARATLLPLWLALSLSGRTRRADRARRGVRSTRRPADWPDRRTEAAHLGAMVQAQWLYPRPGLAG